MAEQARRADHLGRIREGEGPRVTPNKDAPHVVPSLVDYLETNFPRPPAQTPYGLDSAIALASQQAEWLGSVKVLQFLRQMIKEQEA